MLALFLCYNGGKLERGLSQRNKWFKNISTWLIFTDSAVEMVCFWKLTWQSLFSSYGFVNPCAFRHNLGQRNQFFQEMHFQISMGPYGTSCLFNCHRWEKWIVTERNKRFCHLVGTACQKLKGELDTVIAAAWRCFASILLNNVLDNVANFYQKKKKRFPVLGTSIAAPFSFNKHFSNIHVHGIIAKNIGSGRQ